MSFGLIEIDCAFRLLDVVYNGLLGFWSAYAVHSLGVEDAISYLHSALALSVAIRACSFIKAAAIPARSALFMVVDACPSRIYCGDFVGLRVVDSSSDRLRSIFFVCNQLASVKAYSFQLDALGSSKRFCCT